MADETFRPRRPQAKPIEEELPDENSPLHLAERVRQAAKEETGAEDDGPSTGNFNIKGQIPAEFAQALKANKSKEISQKGQAPRAREASPNLAMSGTGSSHLRELIEGLKGHTFEEIELPSRGRFYDGDDGPSNGVVSLRPMTGEEEQILATPRFVKKGQAINMIFSKCLKEGFQPEKLLTIDRTYILIYLRGISYSPIYDVEIKCPECDKKFSHNIDLNSLYVEGCPDDFGPLLQDVLPKSRLPFSYRLSTGQDEQDINDYRERRVKAFGGDSADDTLIYRTAALLDHIDGITQKNELQILLKNLSINDVSYIRGCINEPPFGVDTNVEILCPMCLHDFEVDLPLEANFFFPRRKKTKTQA
jgi:hypothetical protein